MQQSFSRSSLMPSGFVVESAYQDGDRAIITVRFCRGFGSCPSCGTVSRRVHSHYRRQVTDLPLSGRIVQPVVIARRFRCDTVLCGRHLYRALRRRRIGPMCGREKIDLLQARLIGAE
jgi:hypothetical protein